MTFGREPVVRLVNRVVDEHGARVPVEYMIGGEAVWIRDFLDAPIGIARILVQQSMYKIDPVTSQPSFRLGCEKLGVPEVDLPVAETIRTELIDRDLLPNRKVQAVKIYNPINPGLSRGSHIPRPTEDGAQPGEFGFREG